MATALITIPLLLLISTSSSTLAVAKFWNIDCGAEKGFTSTTNLTWVGDGAYVRTGKSVEVTSNITIYQTLRAFPKNKKNCYTIPVGEGVKVLVTLRFYYGNYDGLGTTPSFDIIFDSTPWRSSFTPSASDFSSASVIYVTRRKETNICFGRLSDDQDPFVSSIMVRTLEAGSYGELNSSFVLWPLRAVAFGSHEFFSYPDDPYNRPWNPTSDLLEGFNYTILAKNTSPVNTSGSADSPPERIFRSAAAPLPGERNLSIRMTYMIPIPFPIYLNLHFSEVSKNATRSFEVYRDGEPLFNGSVVPPRGKSLELSALLKATNETTITLVPTPRSTLPPLINGMEVLLVVGTTSDGTSSDDEIWNIDCGATEPWFQDYTNLSWVPGGEYASSGVDRVVANTTGVSQRHQTLRAFPERRKNCYTIPVGAETKVKVWVSFYYGNYDGLANPPSFRLLLDGNDWSRLETELDQPVDATAVYTAARSSTDICFARIADDQVPFVSSIQVVALGSEMYSKVNSTTALYNPNQIALGAAEYIRSPDDPYDRFWLTPEEGLLALSSNNTAFTNATSVSTSTCPDDPPAKFFENAVTPLIGASTNLSIMPSYLSSTRRGIYLNMYFTEVNGTTLRGKRMFDVYMDGELISNASAPIAPRVGEAIEFSYVTFAPKVSNDTVFTLAPTKDSALPPIISGFET